MGLSKAKVGIRQAIGQGKSLDWVDESIISRASLTTAEKAALYLYAFAMLPAAEQARVVRESFVIAATQVAHLN